MLQDHLPIHTIRSNEDYLRDGMEAQNQRSEI